MKTKEMKMRVRTTPTEVAQYAELKRMMQFYAKLQDKASERQRAVYIAEGRPMSGDLNTPGLFAPKSAAVKAADAEFQKAMEIYRNFRKKVGAKRLSRLHALELAGLI